MQAASTSPALFSTLLVLLAVGCSSGGGSSNPVARRFVVPGGTGDGGSWGAAGGDLQAAIDASLAGEEVWVAAGTYTPRPGLEPRKATFRLKSGVTVRGGFAGHEGALGARSFGPEATVLSGDLSGDDGPGFTGRADNCYQVVVAIDAEGSGALENLTIRGGHADGPGFGPTPASLDQGSGLNVYDSSPRLLRVVFEDNWSVNHGTSNDHGSHAVYEDCVFRRNYSDTFGSGLYIHHHSHALAVGCLFEENEAREHGAGVYSRAHEHALVQASTFRGNRAQQGAGVYVAPEGGLQVVDCLFEDNEAMIGGGGVYSDLATPIVEGCVFSRNAAGVGIEGGGGGGGGSGGAGFWGIGGAPLVQDCRFERNQASFGAGVYLIEDCSATVRRSHFADNSAHEAGGLYSLGCTALVEDCTFERNTALGGAFPVAGGVSCYFANTTIRRSTFRDNLAELGGGGIYLEGEFPVVEACTFVGNEANGATEGWGGGLMVGFFCHGWVENCLFVGNRARRGGGYFAMAFADAMVANCTMVANTADFGGPAATSEIFVPPMRNCIAFGNQPAELGGVFDVRYSCLEVAVAGEGNSTGDPAFATLPAPGADGRYGTDDDQLGDLRLLPTSHCIDAGDNTALRRSSQTDLAGSPRFVDDPLAPDLGVPAAPLVDRGAHERQP